MRHFSERFGGNLVIPCYLPPNRGCYQILGAESTSVQEHFCTGAMGLRPTKLQSGAERGFAGSHGSHRQSSDTSKEGPDAKSEH